MLPSSKPLRGIHKDSAPALFTQPLNSRRTCSSCPLLLLFIMTSWKTQWPFSILHAINDCIPLFLTSNQLSISSILVTKYYLILSFPLCCHQHFLVRLAIISHTVFYAVEDSLNFPLCYTAASVYLHS
uniref:Uncharacterized protein n=1 Tax=Rousettus aegyptiacus TaxID=9407 RepID=A0A7J8BSI4_ROUAE|nr:hypothetical protein HJG63_009523 [Rousettus aegyptiacus]